ncbi:hypothetical protein GCM10010124_22210 [Pilimelia terevasa]|uniref:PepSY domain-containing protein n=1 Tax=Pilimelia terevasa TaxID=53372 RepID=A0A8J3BKY2_9ACTN|nr:PepSY domain-containing protein [Pilimelia terevasa]GGK29010.1 hypothetical protein GCM10010124_22210 [Pilimelia terevasa]
MRTTLITAIAGITLALVVGTATANAKDRGERRTPPASPGGQPGFDLEIDPELDARFGPRPVNASRAAAIVADAFPGARVTEAELDEADGVPIWEVKFRQGRGQAEVEVDAITGGILSDD